MVIASQPGHRLPPLTEEQNKALATTPVEALLDLPFLRPGAVSDSLHAYQISKRGNAQCARFSWARTAGSSPAATS